MIPGEILIDEDAPPITANEGRETLTLLVEHTGDRPIQVGSHYHFFEVNKALRFDRDSCLWHAAQHSGGDRGTL